MDKQLRVKITSYIKETDGTYSISIIILPTNKEYTYVLSSLYILEKIIYLINNKYFGKALIELKKNNINNEKSDNN